MNCLPLSNALEILVCEAIQITEIKCREGDVAAEHLHSQFPTINDISFADFNETTKFCT